MSGREIVIGAAKYYGWLVFFLLVAKTIGLLPSVFVFLVSFIRIHGRESWARTLGISALAWSFAFVLFHEILRIPWPAALIGDLFPDLRSIVPLY